MVRLQRKMCQIEVKGAQRGYVTLIGSYGKGWSRVSTLGLLTLNPVCSHCFMNAEKEEKGGVIEYNVNLL